MSVAGRSEDYGPLLCIMGPTAAGKTDLAIALAESLNGELISVDSALVYEGLNIGAAKPDYPHHLIDIRDPASPYSAADFVVDARRAIADIVSRGKQPILVGGTMLYFRALMLGLDDMPPADPAVRADIEREASVQGWPAMHAVLAEVDPVIAATIHPNHSQRISRALEVWRQTGRPMSDWQQGPHGQSALAHLPLIVCPRERRWLHERISLRLDRMFDQGFLEEVTALHRRPDLHTGLPAVRAVGYRQLWSYLDGEWDWATARERARAATRQLAKRQLTWLRSWPGAYWLDTDLRGAVLDVRDPQGAGLPIVPGGRQVDVALTLWGNYLRKIGS